MKVTFLIGNGFDLNLGLRTTYKSFYENYIQNLSEKIKDNNILYSYISKDIEDWVDFETRLGLFTFPIYSKDKSNLMKKAKVLSEDNAYIENEINKDIDISNEEFLSALINFRKDFKKYLTKEVERISTYEYLISGVLQEGLLNFANDFKDNEKMNIYLNMASNIIRYKDSKIKSRLIIDYSFLTFNYTEFLEVGKKNINLDELSKQLSQYFSDENYNQFQIMPNIGPIYHVHSKLSDGMFLGVDNDKQLYSKRFDKKQLTSLIKPLSNEKYNNMITDKADEELFSSNIIVIYGMALGITDLTWWKKIIAFLKQKESNIVLIHKFDVTINTEEDDFYDLADKKEEIKDNLLSFDETLSLEEISNLKNKIFVNLNSPNIFESSTLRKLLNSKSSPQIFTR